MNTEKLEPRKHTLTYIEPKAAKRLKTNPLHLDSPYRVKFDNGRRLGKSTALSLQYIAIAINNPYTWVELKDHHGTIAANFHLFQMIKEHVSKLGLIQFYFKSTNSNFFIAFGDPKE